MIIGREHRYVFVELPRTGCTAVGKELIASYGGERILTKHSTYSDFLRHASTSERGYFAFSSIRNPLDDAVSHYMKISSDHHGRYSDPVRRKYSVGNRGADVFRSEGTDNQGRPPKRRSLSDRKDNRIHRYITRTDADFAAFFRRFHWLPYDNWSSLDHQRLDHVIRFERLEETFAEALEMLGLTLVRPLPVKNKTDAKDRHWSSYYTPEIIPRAKFVFGPYMHRWGYEFPAEWGDAPPMITAETAYRALSPVRTVYWRHVRSVRFGTA